MGMQVDGKPLCRRCSLAPWRALWSGSVYFRYLFWLAHQYTRQTLLPGYLEVNCAP